MKDGWELRSLQALCNNYKQDIVDGPFGSELQRKDYVNQGIPVLKIQNIKPYAIELKKMDYVLPDKFKELKRHSYKSGDIVMTKLGNPLGVSAIVKDMNEGLIVADLVRIRAQKIDTNYLCYQLNSQLTSDYINSRQKGTTRPRVTLSVVRELPIAVPSLQEQQRIVALLDHAFEGIAKARASTEQNLQNARALFESHLQSLFTQRGEGWMDNKLGEVCDLFQGLCINAKTKHLLVEKSSLPLLRIKDLRDNSAELYIAETGWPKNAYVSKSEIIYTRTGQIGLVFRGRVGILHNNCFKIKPRPALNEDYIFWWLQNPAFRARITVLASKTAQPDITHLLFKAQPILIPPRAYQDQAIDTINKMRIETQCLEAFYQRKIALLDELKKSLLQQAFAGEL